jgi:AcrR family transcriptional regulator
VDTVPERILRAVADLVRAHGVDAVVLRDVAARAGVSRQTLYNTFGDRAGLLSALVLRETRRLLDRVEDDVAGAATARAAVHAGVRLVLAEAARNPLLHSALTRAGSDQVASLLTIRGRPVLDVAVAHLAGLLAARWPGPEVDLAAETAVRLTVSHLLLPRDPVDLAADKVARAVATMLRSLP